MNVFVTGGAGFIGSFFCNWLLDHGHQVTAYDNLLLGRKEFIADLLGRPGFRFLQNDLLSDPLLPKHLEGHDLVVHLAANSDISKGSAKTEIDLGMIATYNVLEAMRTAKVTKIIFSSTSAIYGESRVIPTPENYGPLIPISFYGASKLAAEALIAAYAHNYNFISWIYRFANIVGPNLTHGAIYDFKQRLSQNSKKLTVLGNGLQKKSYLHVLDCVEGFWWGFQHSNEEVNLFNLASQGTSEVRFIAESVVKQMGLGSEIEFGSSDRGWKGDVPVTFLDNKKLKDLGWVARLPSDAAVTLSIKENILTNGVSGL